MTNFPERSASSPLDHIGATLQRERGRVGLTLSEVAKRAGIAKSTLSQLEAGSTKPSVETLWAISVALDVPIASLLEPPPQSVAILRKGEGPALPNAAGDYAATLLSSCPPGRYRDIFRISAEPGVGRHSHPHQGGVIEHVILATGRASVGVADDPVELAAGDYVVYPGDVAHLFVALEPGTTAVLISEHP